MNPVITREWTIRVFRFLQIVKKFHLFQLTNACLIGFSSSSPLAKKVKIENFIFKKKGKNSRGQLILKIID